MMFTPFKLPSSITIKKKHRTEQIKNTLVQNMIFIFYIGNKLVKKEDQIFLRLGEKRQSKGTQKTQLVNEHDPI